MKRYTSLCRRHISLLLLAVFFVSSGLGQHLYTVETLPSPKEVGQDFYVSNPDGMLSSATVDQLNRLSTDIEHASGAEYAVVVVNDFEGYDVFEFALKLFNTWGIGKHGQNNGLLLFIAKDRREYRFISGYGMEAIFPDVYLHRIGEKYLVPHFKAGDYDQGVLDASQAIQQALTAPDVRAELQRMMPEATPFFSRRNPYFVNSMGIILLYVALYYWVHRAGRTGLRKEWMHSQDDKTKFKAKFSKKGKGGCSNWFAYLALGGLATIFTMLFVMMIFAFVIGDIESMFQPATLPYVFAIWGSYTVAFKIWEARKVIKESYQDEENKLKALQHFQLRTLIPYVASPLMLFSFFMFRQKWKDSRVRFVPPDDSGDWKRVDRDEVVWKVWKSYLSEGQLKEESLGSRAYEVWINKKTKEKKVLGWPGKNAKTYAKCPSCGFYMYEKNKRGKILKVATYNASGLQEVYDQCRHCKRKEDKRPRVIPKLVRSSGGGSSSSGGGGFSGGSSSGGSGSFGGGSSGGGGAGGRW
ncbi:TPM domain-containing protein [Sphingobacterium sp. DN00404]|uniref:TPM domain-containing protein n=1 Tax=Sphingobacterium micropteri TaxID=2763501 RepID=A0ABR7YPA7_9SPHI|nr:TPM domain-containing protein [Sphingobacterium micropteri]MBD1433135.1 TPM domain-containing protein [Sphingobacterium micropteri]